MIRRTIPRPPERTAWLAARHPYVGASEVPVVMGASPYRTAGDLAAEKLGLTDGQPQNAAMDRGNRLEDAVAQWWAVEHGTDVEEVDVLHVIVSDEDEPVLCATLDRTVGCFPHGALEVKTTRDYIDQLPEHWVWQAHAQMLCAGLAHIEFAVLDATMQLKSFTVAADFAAQTLLYEKSLAFMRAIRCGQMPDDVEMSYATVAQLHPKPSTARVDLDNGAGELVRALELVHDRKAQLERDEAILKGRLARRLGDATDGYVNGRLAVTWRAYTRHDVDAKALRRDHPEIAREYARATTSRRMLLK